MDLARAVDPTPKHLGVVVSRRPRDLHGGKLGRLVGYQGTGRQVTDHQLQRRQGRGKGEGHGEREPLVVVAAAPQPGHRVDRCDSEPGGHVEGDHEVPELIAERVREEHRDGVNGDDPARVDGDTCPACS